VIGWLYDLAGRKVEKGELGERRHELVSGLEGEVLEVGAGTGFNLPHYEKATRVLAVEPDPSMACRLAKRAPEASVPVEILSGSAESLPFADASFDVAFCDHGAFTFTDPLLSIPEAARVLRPGGLLAFSHSSPFDELCWDEASDSMTPQLQRPYFGLHRRDWTEYVTFNLPYGEWIRLFRAHGLVVDDLVELRPPKGASTTFTDLGDRRFARRWPAEQIWKAHKA
jgi:ubiquinone/menaquinone biosynthesis C-methylase UbiE